MPSTAVRSAAGKKAPADDRTLKDLRGVGKAIESDLHKLGIRTVADLAQANGLALYNRLCGLTGTRQDPCVLDTFRCAVAQAKNPDISPEQANWWWWSRQRKLNRV